MSETTHLITQYYIPQDLNLQHHQCQNLTSYMKVTIYLFLKYCTEVVIPKQYGKLIVTHGSIKLTQPMVSQL